MWKKWTDGGVYSRLKAAKTEVLIYDVTLYD